MNGLDIARQRIAEESEVQTGMLDLGRLGLNRLPDELFELKHLRVLNLGMGFATEHNKYIQASANIAPNRISERPQSTRKFTCTSSAVSPRNEVSSGLGFHTFAPETHNTQLQEHIRIRLNAVARVDGPRNP